ncbi:hypothetical protein [Aquabacterium sp.]|uniref:hypothetical protein n=1 Tax=Aquabacterium sp. TaxID=1872578 RepID=UPI003D6D71AB
MKQTKMMKTPLLKVAVLVLVASGSLAAHAVDFSYSAFGTIGAAVSDQDYRYQRFIDSDVGFKRDSVLGAQVDAQFTPELSATVQAKVAPSMRNDRHWDLSASWAFASWRPNNDWLLRAGKVRIPLYLSSENMDVGQSYDFARLPTEMYSIAPTTDVTGLYITRNWTLPASELSMDVYSGQAKVWIRVASRDTGVGFYDYNTHVSGSVLTWRADDTMLRFGWHHAGTKSIDGPQNPQSVTYVPMVPGVGFYNVSSYTQKIVNDIFTIGFDQRLPDNWRVMLELERNFQHDTDLGANTAGGYLALLKTMDRWTPYVAVSKLKTVGAPARLREAVNQVDPASLVPLVGSAAAAQIGAGQRQLVDGIPFYDQHSLAIGASYAITPHSKVKAELLHTWVKRGSVLVDSPSGGPAVSDQGINVLSLSYNFAF